jgi:hypothetical protein
MGRYIGLIVACLCIVLDGCSGGGNSVSNAFDFSSPSSVVKKLFNACNAGEYSKAKELYTTSLQKTIDGDLGALAGGMKGICDDETRNGTITNVEIKSEDVRGEGAVVIANIHFKDGNTKEADKSELIKENGVWRLAK